jgi:predicted amidohydrolase
MILDLLTFDPSLASESPLAYAEEIARLVIHHWDSGADLVLLPEFTWMGLEPLIERAAGQATVYPAISALFWDTLLPQIQPRLSREGKAVVLGTVPYVDPTHQRVYNRAPILKDGHLSHQDKLHLTPWEKDFSQGSTLYVWSHLGFRITVIICLDIEIPEISAQLRGQKVDLILCPSATETLLGVERVDRCASARAVELGCHVAVTHLTGEAKSDLIDVNVGRLAHYTPSQASFRHGPRTLETEIWSSGVHSQRLTLDKKSLEHMRRMFIETNPSHIGKDSAGQFTLQQMEPSPQ